MTKNSSTFVKLLNCFSKTDCLIDIQQMMCVLVEPRDAFGCEAPSESKYEVVVGKLSFNLAVGNDDASFKGIDVGDFSFDEVDSSIQHCLSQVEGDVGWLNFPESESYKCWIENKLAAPRHERNLMLVAELLGETLCGNDTAEPATQYQDPRHR